MTDGVKATDGVKDGGGKTSYEAVRLDVWKWPWLGLGRHWRWRGQHPGSQGRGRMEGGGGEGETETTGKRDRCAERQREKR